MPTFLRHLRSTFAFALLLVSFALAGPVQRLICWPLIRLRLATRDTIMSAFMWHMSGLVFALARLGGARVRRDDGCIRTAGPLLIVMNHQSLLDIPTVLRLCRPWVPQIVTRRRYAWGIPMVSPMLRLMSYPLIDPAGEPREALSILKHAAATQAHGVVIFPEGHRSRDGSLRPFESAGLRLILGARALPVYLVVTDGFWTCRTFTDFVWNIHRIDGRTEVLGPFQTPASASDLPGFVDELHSRMRLHLEGMRAR